MGTVQVFGGGRTGGIALAYPAIEYSGEYVRRVIDYGGIWYYEYIFTTSGVLTVSEALTCDVFLVGSGGAGAGVAATNTTNMNPSPGGASGYPVYALGVELSPEYYDVSLGISSATSIDLPDETLVAQKGGSPTASYSSTTMGTGFTGTYYLYGDENLPCGTGGGATGGTPPAAATVPGRGGGGCALLPNIYPDWGFTRETDGSNYNWEPIKPEYGGFGAGAFGYSVRYVKSPEGYAFMLYTPAPAPGAAALRIPV
jgi:hypothetical protein